MSWVRRRPSGWAVCLAVLLAVGLLVSGGHRARADLDARRHPKPKACPSVLTRASLPTVAAPPPSAGTTTTTAPCRATELLAHARWVGVLSWRLRQPVAAGTQLSEALVDLALTENGKGELTGKLEGTQTQTLLLSTCPSSTVTPGTVKAHLTGERTGTTMRLTAGAIAYTPPDVTPCPGSGAPGVIGGLFVFPQTAPALQSLIGNAKRGYRYRHQETVTVGAGPYPYTLEYSILVVRIKG